MNNSAPSPNSTPARTHSNERPLPPIPDNEGNGGSVLSQLDVAGAFANMNRFEAQQTSRITPSESPAVPTNQDTEQPVTLVDFLGMEESSGPLGIPNLSFQIATRPSLGDEVISHRSLPPLPSSVIGTSTSSQLDARSEDTRRRRSSTQTTTAARSTENLSRSVRHAHGSSSDSGGDSPLVSRTPSSQIRRGFPRPTDGIAHVEEAPMGVPRWQPDVEVTLCPICRTQFSFFVRKHHCRKCGRVVCGNCSPHRITIPYQYIVQPPLEEAYAARSRPTLDAGRVRSSTVVENLGGGERVRLCNPCVPDPNIAPPQIPEARNLPNRPSPQGHTRSASTANPPPSPFLGSAEPNSNNPSATTTSYPRRPRQPSVLSTYRPSAASYTDRSNQLSRPESLQARSRSSTVGVNQNSSTMTSQSQQTHNFSHPYPQNTRPTQRTPTPRRRIPEEDECWVCHQELPSRTLPNFDDLRTQHVNNCIATAMSGSPSPAPAPPPTPAQTTTTSTLTPSQPSSSRTPATIPNTPEGRMAARERAHAAVVLAPHSQPGSSPTPIRRSRVFPYLASEKDCADDAECTICLEEFEVGVEMGRLECFCRFHLKCIREWFVGRPGMCPVHQHGAGY